MRTSSNSGFALHLQRLLQFIFTLMKTATRIFLSLSLPVFVLMSCHASLPEGYLIHGTVKNWTLGGTIFIDELSLTTAVTIDTSKVSDKGEFEFTGHVAGPGLYRVRLNNSLSWILVLDEKPCNIQLDVNAADANDYSIIGSPPSAAIKKIIDSTNARNNRISLLTKEFSKVPAGPSADSIRMAIQKKQNELLQYSKSSLIETIDTTKNPIVILFSTYMLNIQTEMPTIFVIVKKQYELHPDIPFVKNFYEAFLKIQADQVKQANNGNFGVGDSIPDIQLNSPDGNPISLYSLRGQYVLLDFWASWCHPCRLENPNVVAAYKKYNSKGFTVYGVSLDTDPAKWKAAIQQDGLIWTNHVSQLKAWQSDVVKQFGFTGIPHSLLIDKKGKVIGVDLRGPALDQKLKEVFGD